MQKVVSLSVHKNTLAKRRKRDLKEAFRSVTKEIFDNEDVKGFAVVFVTGNHETILQCQRGDMRPAEFQLLVQEGVKDISLYPSIATNDEAEQT